MDKLPLFVISGALGVGKTSAANELISRNNSKYIVLSGAMCNIMTFPEFMASTRKTWVDICISVSEQTGRSVVFYDDLYPDTFDGIDPDIRSRMHYIALVCDNDTLRLRVEEKLGDKAHKRISNIDKTHFEMAELRNHVYLGNTKYQYPGMERLDTTDMTVKEVADRLDEWICKRIVL